MSKDYFIPGKGYVRYETRQQQSYGNSLVNVTGWWLSPTPDGKPGPSMTPEYLGRNKEIVKMTHPWIAQDLGWKR